MRLNQTFESFHPLAGRERSQHDMQPVQVVQRQFYGFHPLAGRGRSQQSFTACYPARMNVSIPLRGEGVLNLLGKEKPRNKSPSCIKVSIPLRGEGVLNMTEYKVIHLNHEVKSFHPLAGRGRSQQGQKLSLVLEYSSRFPSPCGERAFSTLR